MKRRILSALALLLVFSLLPTVALAAEQKSLSEKLVRLHVVANSDSERDQAIKLDVRDAVLAVTDSLDESELACSLGAIADAAREALDKNGCGYSVRVLLGSEDYPAREYESFSLPAGRYRSLRVEIGAAEGRNWWCVVFPPLCFSTSEEFVERAAEAGFSEEELELVGGDGQDIQIRFRILELLQKFAHFLFN